jgi:hypothetical protein
MDALVGEKCAEYRSSVVQGERQGDKKGERGEMKRRESMCTRVYLVVSNARK